MESTKEREKFSIRLKEALQEAGVEHESPAVLVRAFNRRYPGKAVSYYTARKWLIGEAIPSQDKLRTLTQWLRVTNNWLRFGDGEKSPEQPDQNQSTLIDYELMQTITRLTDEQQMLIRNLVTSLHIESKGIRQFSSTPLSCKIIERFTK
jgi:transcriptional regulator with XRE-family HTH domain